MALPIAAMVGRLVVKKFAVGTLRGLVDVSSGSAQGRIEIRGMERLAREVRRSVDKDLPKRLGQANKEVGEFIISRLQPRPDPRAVGAGRGATVRPSAAKDRVLLRAGGAHRDADWEQWGARFVGSIGPKPARPYIIESAVAQQDVIEDKYMDAVLNAMKPAFHKVSKG